MTPRLTAFSPAKINLMLRVGKPRPDGFHPLETWFCALSFGDTLTFDLASDGPGPIQLTCSDPGVPLGEANLVWKAAALLARKCPAAPPHVRVHIEKRIPPGGGLGGGSSNAATTLLALNRLWSLDLPAPALETLAGELGSDVAFFIRSAPALGCGRGEQLSPAPLPQARHCLLMLPPFGCATPAVYGHFDKMGLGSDLGGAPAGELANWAKSSARILMLRLINDLEKPAFAMERRLNLVRDLAHCHCDRHIRMSGSGSTLFALFDSEADLVKSRDSLHEAIRSSVYAAASPWLKHLRLETALLLSASEQGRWL